jgi:hypothetical protein
MNVLKKHLRDYLELRRALGFELGRVESRFTGLPCVYENKAGAPDYDQACH